MNRLLLSILIVLLAFTTIQVNAQQRPQYSQYMINNYLLNPAITGIEDYADIRVSHRRQWVGLDGAPVTSYVTAHTP
jgi:type IX secretion system PorP/SprF family membrane protein